jgi:hypothetical protein
MYHIQSMGKFFSLLILLHLFIVPLAADETNSFQEAYDAQLPTDAMIGQIVRGEAGSAEEITKQALREPYGPVWLERYVSEILRKAFANTYNEQLVSLLPAEQVQVGRAMVRSGLYEVPFCFHSPIYHWGTMVWTSNEKDEWELLAIEVKPLL